jgi:hypothetical protein
MVNSTAANPEVLREIVQNVLVKPLEDRSAIISTGARIFDTDGSPVRVPKLLDDPDEPELKYAAWKKKHAPNSTMVRTTNR